MAGGSGEYACNQLPELAIADDRDVIRRSYVHLSQNLKCSCEGLSEYGLPVGDCIRHRKKVHWRQVEELCKCAVAAMNPEDCATETVSWIAGTAELTFAASGVDLADDTTADLRRVGRLFDNPDKLVSEGT